MPLIQYVVTMYRSQEQKHNCWFTNPWIVTRVPSQVSGLTPIGGAAVEELRFIEHSLCTRFSTLHRLLYLIHISSQPGKYHFCLNFINEIHRDSFVQGHPHNRAKTCINSLIVVCTLTFYCLWLLSADSHIWWSEDQGQKLSLLSYLITLYWHSLSPLDYELLKIRNRVFLIFIPNG